ncbi:DUF3828 domain-containing protein [Halpernia frigidisoli]|uniref:DUF3828 domain-containing protein n=1 Tax=Halpernia frigidisoli TaxID=1125876 RepID=A0A1I3IQ19_9FLAO|nr:DUF3828 domain-containing protein [Halpernia frigidisoli]SFI50085.1 Protein of unknown function [Halpernia frigidisoli]
MKTLFSLLIFISVLTSCKQETKNFSKIELTKDSIGVIKSKDAVNTLKEFYFAFYGSDKPINDRRLMHKYVSERVLKRIDSLTANPENIILDYDPFINAQDFDGKVIKKTLEIRPLENPNEYRASFLLFGEKNEKQTNIDFLLKKNKDGKLLIYSILSDNYLNFNSIKTKEKIVNDDKYTSNTITNKEEIINSLESSYKLIQSKQYDLNGDGFNDIFLVFEPIKTFTQEDEITLDSPVYILMSDGKNKFHVFKNKNIIYTFIPNSPAEGFRNLTIKNNFFTIEQQEGSGWFFIDSYTTFKYDKITKEIVLTKYGESFTDRRDPDKVIPDKVLRNGDLKKVSFIEFNSETINKIK